MDFYTIETLGEAIFTVNKHAKTAIDPKFLYTLKKAALDKLLVEGKVKKVGLHFSKNPRNQQQSSDVLISCGNYYFHTKGTKEDFHTLPHLGELAEDYRNPPVRMGLSKAKSILMNFTKMSEPDLNIPVKQQDYRQKYVQPTFARLGESTLTFPSKKK
ncbi:MAG: hypothetical protein K0R18_2916 [Bacillales bacterium]|jgi:hypothetical protein|nr:hypothetical protein [Bacillales bacterium]